MRLQRRLCIWRTEITIIFYFKLSACFPLKSRTDILVVEKSGNQQVHEQKESSPTVTENDEQGSQTFEQAQNFNPKNPIDLNIANIDTA